MAEIERVQGCVSLAWAEYLRLVDAAGAQPAEVAAAMSEHIAELFELGLCTPTPPPQQRQQRQERQERWRLRGGAAGGIASIFKGGLVGQWPEVA